MQMKLFETEEHEGIAATLNTMALIYSNFGQFEKALEMNERVYSRER